MPRLGRADLLWTLPVVLPLTAAVATAAVPREFTRLLLGYYFGSAATVGMVVSAIAIWRRATGAAMRWFWAGAAVWAVAVLLKFVLAAICYDAGIAAARSHLPLALYLAVGSLYAGLFTGIFEDGGTLLAGRKWRGLARDGHRAVAVGIGAGAAEALCFGLPPFLVMTLSVASSGLWTAAERAEFVSAVRDATTSAAWLVLPADRTLALLAHTSSRVLALLTVATGRWRYFWYGFLLSVGVDGLATYFDLTGQLGTISVWWIVLALAPFAVVTVPVVIWCLRRWPEARAAEQALPAAAAAQADAATDSGPTSPVAP